MSDSENLEKEAFVYCISTIDPPTRTYIGATTDVDRRLRQHNGELSGGARKTSQRPGQWYRVCYLRGFTSWREALQVEWRWKHFSRQLAARKGKAGWGDWLQLRNAAMEMVLSWWLERTGVELEVVYE